MRNEQEVIVLQTPSGRVFRAAVDVGDEPEEVSNTTGKFKVAYVQEAVAAMVETFIEPLASVSLVGAKVEVGMELSIESGVVVACISKAGAKASIKLTLEWKKE
jgi:hypothetical protein